MLECAFHTANLPAVGMWLGRNDTMDFRWEWKQLVLMGISVVQTGQTYGYLIKI